VVTGERETLPAGSLVLALGQDADPGFLLQVARPAIDGGAADQPPRRNRRCAARGYSPICCSRYSRW
jgi:hypothetical protein